MVLVIAAIAVILMHWRGNAMQMFGLGLAIVAFTLWVIARVQLDRSFSLRPEAKELVTHGFYSKIRHPIYVFSTLGVFGLALGINRPYFWIIFISVLLLQIWRAGKEEIVLKAAFGQKYLDYKKQTWF